MGSTSRTFLLLTVVGTVTGFDLVAYQTRSPRSRLTARWIGQDQHDYVGPHNRRQASEVQDIHIALLGLDPRRDVVFVEVAGDGGGLWQYSSRSSSWRAELFRGGRARTADLFIEPGGVEKGRSFHVLLRYDDGSTAETDMRGLAADPNLRMPGFSVAAQWIGYDRQDWTGPGPSVGPDGLEDVRIHLSHLSPTSPVKALRVDGPPGARWEFGTNPKLLPNAELIRDPKDPKQADLFFQPDRDLRSQPLRLRLIYDNGQRDATTVDAGPCDATLRMPQAPLPTLVESAATASWLGQDGSNPDSPGDVHVVISGLSVSSPTDGAVLSDAVGQAWVVRTGDRGAIYSEPDARSFKLRYDHTRHSAELFFAPYREAGGEDFTLRLVLANGQSMLIHFKGERCELSRRAPLPANDRIVARPGDDLQPLVDVHGTVVLAPGTFRLTRALVLKQPVTITSEGGTTLVFAQDATEPRWSAAIKIQRGNTTLNGFAVRFEGPVRWNDDISWGPAVIGMTDNLDPGQNEFKPNIVLTHLDLEVPPVANHSGWVVAPRLMRLIRARSGTIAGNTLRGGPIEFFDGPWRIENNDYRGVPPGSSSSAVFAGHGTHELLIKGNQTHSPDPSGKTWRFLFLGGHSSGDVIERNTIGEIGARDDDTIPWSNEPEIILTESYSLRYEGKLMNLSTDGRVLRIGPPQGEGARTGDLVSILAGSAAGQWRRVVQMLDATTVLVDQPIPADTEAVSISEGFTGQLYQHNRIDIRGSRRSIALVLAGNHFGTRVIENRFLGGANAFRLSAYPTEHPLMWGWSHAPFLGGVIEGNSIEDSAGGGLIGLEHDPKHIKSNKGRTYMSVQLNQNVVRWSAPFLSGRGSSAAKARWDSEQPLGGLTLGYPPSNDPGELVVTAEGNRLELPPDRASTPALLIYAAQYNAAPVVNRRFDLSAAGSSSGREAKVPADGTVR
jgi:hypothetical protein